MADEISEMSREDLEQYARALEILEGHRERLEAALPECPAHGSGCTPYAVAWIEKAKRTVTLTDDEIPRPDNLALDALSASLEDALHGRGVDVEAIHRACDSLLDGAVLEASWGENRSR